MRRREIIAAKILTDDEVSAILRGRKRAPSRDLGDIEKRTEDLIQDFEHRVRFRAVAARCYLARERRRLSIKGAGARLRVPQNQLRAIETGSFGKFHAETLSKYIQLLELESWFKRWQSRNRAVVDRLESLKSK